jgi:membrane-bound lytic murein transglycosylase D
MKLWVLICLCLAITVSAAAQEGTPPVPEPAAIPALIPALRIDGPLDFCGELVPLDDQEIRERLEKELLLAMWDRAQVVLWIKRSARYFPVIEQTLQEHNLPADLKYLAVIESALLPHIGSSKGARGFWQFMKATGRRYGLTIDREKDERCNIFSSTRAAGRYLNELYDQFGSWSLAAAAYNFGEDRLRTAIENQEVDNYYHLYLPEETQRYLFKILAAKMILSNPARYGFQVLDDDLYPPLEFDRVAVRCPVNTPLRLIAKAAGTYYKKIKELNPELSGQYLAKGEHTLAIPKGRTDEFQVSYARIAKEWEDENRPRLYTVQEGDNLSAIAARFDVPLQSLLHWNEMNSRGYIYPGSELIIDQ